MDAWLQSLGLGHRAAAFAAHDINRDQRADLTDDDLKELGLTIGERIRFRRAVAALAAEAAPPVASPLLETTRAEHRPLTMMFVDLVNSSGLAERLEPEDLLETIRRYREFCNNAIIRFGGHVAQLIGDGILAYFCYPVANENDPERAVRAALLIAGDIESVATPHGAPLTLRIGIATGRVIVSDLFTGGKADKASIIGSTPNLAARLQSFASPNGIVIADETYQRVRERFRCTSLGSRVIRGFAQPATSWIVHGEAAPPDSTAARRPQRLTPFFNRHAEFETLEACWVRAQRGEGGAVVLHGEAGIGKSRLVENFLATRVRETARVIQVAGSAFDENSPFHPCIAHLRAISGMSAENPPETKLEKLEAVLGGDADERARSLPILADLIGIPFAASLPVKLQPDQLRARTLSIMLDHLLRQTTAQPLCLVVEDVHWLDPSTHELLGLLLESIAGRRLLLLLTVREGYDAPWMGRRETTVLHLLRLAPGDVAGMIGSLFGEHGLPPAVARQIARKTDGVPLFVEEVARSLLQRSATAGDGAGDDAWRMELVDEPDHAIPASLRESLMARLDRSGAAKQIAQIAAVAGRSVRRDMLALVSGMAGPELDQALAMLIDAGVVDQEFIDQREGYTFRHALLRDAAYDSLLRDPRREMHLRVAGALRTLDSALIESQPELLALHLTEAGLAEEAAEHWMSAARRSLARSALTEAMRLLTRGLTALERAGTSPANLTLRLRLSGLLGPVLMGLKGHGSAEVHQHYLSALGVCRELPEADPHFPIHWGWWRISPDFHAQLERSRSFLHRAQAHQRPAFILEAHHCNWASHYHAGDFDRCCAHVTAGLAIYHEGDYRHHASLYGNHDAKACAHGEMAQVLWMRGSGQSALAEERQSLEWARSLDHLGSHVHALDFSLLHRAYRRDHAGVFRQAEDLITFTTDAGLADLRSKGQIFRGWAMAAQGNAQPGLAELQEGLTRQREIGTTEDLPVYLCLLADALIGVDRPEAAIDALRDGLTKFDTIGLRVWIPEVLRTLGESILAAAPDRHAEAEAVFAAAAALAGRQGAAMLGLRVAMSQARLDQRLDRLTDTTARLSATLGAVPEREGADVAAAEALLATLRGAIA